MRIEKTLVLRPGSDSLAQGDLIPALNVKVFEKTVSEIRAWLAMPPDAVSDWLVGSFLSNASGNEISVHELLWMTDLQASDLDSLTPSEMAQVVAAMKAVNSAFFVLAAKGRQLAAMPSEISSAPSASSLETATVAASGTTPTQPS